MANFAKQNQVLQLMSLTLLLGKDLTHFGQHVFCRDNAASPHVAAVLRCQAASRQWQCVGRADLCAKSRQPT